MSFEQEWEQQKTEASEKQPTQMQLNQAKGPGGHRGADADGDLVVHDDQLGKLGDMGRDLRERLSTYGDHARQTTFDASIELFNDGMDTGSALTELHDAWNTKLTTLKEACAHISNHLDYTRSAHRKDEDKIITGMKNAEGKAMTVSRIYEYIK
ncbi:conserved hypothetical protein [Streptomyces himastatinicus ATCC 53653]|uniref:AG1 protein n=1 Tax=Streptomyces himastatinicus ATCC 53653 TaxID=457427 RepID=D9WSJ4_9ACTN|nr:hypothetical protein [Streptomyces himastatinicus]EFL22135.1 conserved hypothetical protein [Streptomyces himastatinicus ATCC 53653]CCC21128.1 hypothetical protein [Streptomyces himastatinicus ATCC 53653]